jgi:hypothetical protein
MIVIMYRVYQLGGNASDSLNLLCLGLERKVNCYNGYFINEYILHTEEYGQGKKTYNSKICVKGLTFNEFEANYYGKLEDVI